jgi:hypothetical protein
MPWIHGVGWDTPVDATGTDRNEDILYWDGKKYVTWAEWMLAHPVKNKPTKIKYRGENGNTTSHNL